MHVHVSVYVFSGDEIVCYVEKFYKDKCLVNFFTNGKLVFRHWGHTERENVYATIGVKFGPAHLVVQWPKPGEFKIDTVCSNINSNTCTVASTRM